MLKQLVFAAFVFALNYNGNLQFEKDFKPCVNSEWATCATKLYENSGEMWRLYTIKDRFSAIRGLLYYNFVSPNYTDGQILATFYAIVPHVLSRLI